MLRILIADGNERSSREPRLAEQGKTSAESYADVVRALVPEAACTVVYPADGDGEMPRGTSLDGFDGLVFTGSSLKVTQDVPAVTRQLDLMRAAYAAGLPTFGSCWGLHVAAAAAGGTVGSNPRGPEYGFARRIVPTGAGERHGLLAGRGSAWDAPAIHSDVVLAPPDGATVLAQNGVADVQAIEIRRGDGWFWGVQYHPELDPDELASMLRLSADGIVEAGLAADAEAVTAYADEIRSLSHGDGARARQLAWRHGLGPEILDEAARRREIGNFLGRLREIAAA